MVIGYARVSTRKQHLDRQVKQLKEQGCARIFSEKASGISMKHRPELDKAIAALSVGDILVVAEWDRATRSMQDGIEIIHRVHAQGAMLKALDRPSLDLTTPTGKAVLHLLSAFAEEERNRIVRRATDGRQAAKKRGVRFGRPARFQPGSPARIDIEHRLLNGESCYAIAQIYLCSHNTIVGIRDKLL